MIELNVVDPVYLTGQVIGAALEGEPDIRIMGIASTAEDALALLEEKNCTVVLISAISPHNEALELISLISERWPDVKCLVYGLPDSSGIILRYIEAGAAGYVLQEDSAADLLHNIRAVAEERALISSEIAAKLMIRIVELAERVDQLGMDPDVLSELTPREKEVLDLIGQDMSNAEIAERLTVAVGTVKNHVHNILDKLNVNSRRDAALYLTMVEDLSGSIPAGSEEEAQGTDG